MTHAHVTTGPGDPGNAANVTLVVNPRSGHGKSVKVARAALEALRRAGHKAHAVELGRDGPECVGAAVAGSAVAVAVGGDGTVQCLAGLLSGETPGAPAVYHLPCGNENLFAREFGMRRSVEQLVAALAAAQVVAVDLARITGVHADGGAWCRPVLLMAGFSVDAGVIERLHARRSRAIGRTMYVRPILEEMLAPHFPRQSVYVDGRELIANRRGMLHIANCAQYARGLNPCRLASMTDGLLDAGFMPCTSLPGAALWLGRAWLGRLERHAGFVHGKAPEIETDFSEPTPCQIDGEALGFPVVGRVRMRVEPRALKVLLPPGSRIPSH